MNHNKKPIFYYIYDKRLIEVSRNIPNIGNRAAVVQSLIASYNLPSKCQICPCDKATDEDLLSFHSAGYLECLKKTNFSTDLEKMAESEEVAYFNLSYDCPLFENIYEFVKLIAGSSLTAAKKLVSNLKLKRKAVSNVLNSQPRSYLKCGIVRKLPENKDVFEMCFNENEDNSFINQTVAPKKTYEIEVTKTETDILPVSINWFGGWHHAERDEAGGFCYVNDVVIAIQYLLKFYRRILYIDLDIHHGNGVENAFYFTQKVLTFSLHKFEPGFYPLTGSINDIGGGRGKYYTVNIPLKDGITDNAYIEVFKKIYLKIMDKYQPECIVVQCGADCISSDPLGGFNLTLHGIGECMKLIMDSQLPVLVLGGGGYNEVNSAKCWAYLTSLILKCQISDDIPDNPFLHLYGPDFQLQIAASLRKNENSPEFLNTIVNTVLQNLEKLQPYSLEPHVSLRSNFSINT